MQITIIKDIKQTFNDGLNQYIIVKLTNPSKKANGRDNKVASPKQSPYFRVIQMS